MLWPWDYEWLQLVCVILQLLPDLLYHGMALNPLLADTGEEKKKLVLSLGAERWVDFRESKDVIDDVKKAVDGQGVHGAVIAAGDVSFINLFLTFD